MGRGREGAQEAHGARKKTSVLRHLRRVWLSECQQQARLALSEDSCTLALHAPPNICLEGHTP